MILRVTVACLASATLALGVGWAAGVRLNLTGSIPAGLYRESAPAPGALHRGTIVLVCLPIDVAEFARARAYLPRGSCPGRAMPVGKFVIATVGDTVTLCDSGIRINGALLARSLPLLQDRSRRPLPKLARGRYIVARGMIWLGSRSDEGFDSRYFGAVPSRSVIATLTPLSHRARISHEHRG